MTVVVRIVAAIFTILCCCACGTKQRTDTPTPELATQRVAAVRAWAPTCDGHVSKGGCDQGDVMAYSGYLCMAGEEIGCKTARDSFDDQGRAWRNPRREPLGDGNSFSRDMLLGALYYFAATKDTQTENKFREYVRTHGRLCPDATDNRCEMTPGMWGLWGEVAIYIGAELTSTMKINMLVDDKQLYLQSISAPEGYQRELVAAEIILRRKTNSNSKLLEWASAELLKREPENPLFEMLENGKSARFWELFLAQVPSEEPADKLHWSIAKPHADEAWKKSMGWEWIFLFGI